MTKPNTRAFTVWKDKLDDFKAYIFGKRKHLKKGFDWETTSLDVQKAEPLGFSLSIKVDEDKDLYEAYYIPVGHKELKQLAFSLVAVGRDCFTPTLLHVENQSSLVDVLHLLDELLLDPNAEVTTHNGQYDWRVTEKLFKNVLRKQLYVRCQVFDTIVSSYCFHYEKKGLKDRILIENGITAKRFEDIVHPLYPAVTAIPNMTHYCCDDTVNCQILEENHRKIILNSKKGQIHYGKLPLILQKSKNAVVLAHIENNGIPIDLERVYALEKEWNETLTRTAKEFVYLTGELGLNVSSPSQVSDLMFVKKKWWNPNYSFKKTEVSSFCADKEVLSDLFFYDQEKQDAFSCEEAKQACLLYKDYSEVKKLLSSYIEPLKKFTVNGRLHPNLSQVFIATGRLQSGGGFNVQTMPSRTDRSRKLRDAVRARPGFKIVGCDAAQAEIRLLAHLADVKLLKEAFANGVDVHKQVADSMGVDRRTGKELNLGIGYGMGADKLARKLHIKTEKAKQFLQKYNKTMPEIREFKDWTEQFVRKHGFVTSIGGHTRSFAKELALEKKAIQQGQKPKYWFNEAFNHPVQASNNDYITECQVRLYDHFCSTNDLGEDIFIILQVHDEILFEVREDRLDDFLPKIQEIMEDVSDYYNLSVRFKCEPSYGDSWLEAK